MGCPFMKRYSKAYLAKHPHKKGKDLDATKKALHTFQQTPATLMSFIEGTRYTSQKKSAQNSPYRYLLKPKSGGIGFVINTMNQKIQHLLDVTIVYPDVKHSLWRFLCRQVDSIKVHVRLLPIPQAFLTPSLLENEETLSLFRDWLNEEWNKKDQLIHQMKQI